MPSLKDVITAGLRPLVTILDYSSCTEKQMLWRTMTNIGGLRFEPTDEIGRLAGYAPIDSVATSDSGAWDTFYTNTNSFGSDDTPPWSSESNRTYLSEESFSSMSHDVGERR